MYGIIWWEQSCIMVKFKQEVIGNCIKKEVPVHV